VTGIEENVAYIAIGADRAWMAARQNDAEGWSEGHIEYIAACCRHAQLLEDLYKQHDGEFTGVFAYDVAEEFGFQYGSSLLRGGEPVAAQYASRLAAAAISTDRPEQPNA